MVWKSYSITRRAWQAPKQVHLTWMKEETSACFGFIVISAWGKGEGSFEILMVWTSLLAWREGSLGLYFRVCKLGTNEKEGVGWKAISKHKTWIQTLLLMQLISDVSLMTELCCVSFNWIWTCLSKPLWCSMRSAAWDQWGSWTFLWIPASRA